jgi:hypothetical protein
MLESEPIGGTFTLTDPCAGQSDPIPFDAPEEEIEDVFRRLIFRRVFFLASFQEWYFPVWRPALPAGSEA